MGFSHLILLLLVSVELLCPPPVRGNAEMRALMEIKASLDPENKILTSWTENGDPCSGSFAGVACNEHLKVANISLQGKGLSGSISPSVADLKCLSGLYLHYNSLTGLIPKEISNLTELTELYLDMNNLSGLIPPEIGDMAAVQVLQLCCNNFTGIIPEKLGSLKKLSVLDLQNNELSGPIPSSLGNLGTLTRLVLSFNQLTGKIPSSVASIQELQFLDVQDNLLSGLVPSALKRLDKGFLHKNNPGLCGFDFPSLRNCTMFDGADTSDDLPFGANTNRTVPIPNTPNQRHSQRLSNLPIIAIITGIVTVTIALLVAALVTFYRYRRSKQKIGSSTVDLSESRFSNSQSKDVQSRGTCASPLTSLGFDPLDDTNGLFLQGFRFTLEEIESATHYFSDANLLGKSKFSSVYKGVLRDGSVVAIRCINAMSCKSDEIEFVDGLNLVTSLKHDNLVKVRGFCCSKGRGECFLVYYFATKGKLSQYLDMEDGCSRPLPLDWCSRISIIKGIARGIRYLHTANPDKPALVHRNISAEKTLLDQQLNPLIMDSGLTKLLADDVIFSGLKTSAAMGCLAPEYITTGRFTEKSDVYSFGIVVFQIVSGKQRVTCSMKLAAESSLNDLIDVNLEGNFAESEALKLARIAVECIRDDPESRPSMFKVVEELDECFNSDKR